MKQKHFIFVLLGLWSTVLFIACGKKPGDVSLTYNCPKGTAYYNNGYCYDQFNQVLGTYGTTSSTMDVGYLAENFRNSNLTITDAGVFKNFLKSAMGICDQAAHNYGVASCDSWTGSYFQVMFMAPANQPNNIKLAFYVYPNNQSFFTFSAQLPTLEQFFGGLFGFPNLNQVSAFRNPLLLDKGVMSVINSYQGFEIRAYGDLMTTANISLIQLQVNKGKLIDPALDFKLVFSGKQMANGSLYRCINPTCQ